MNYYNYFTEIEEVFVRRRGKNLLLSPLDWALMESWQEREVPLHIVIRAIESVFDIADKEPKRKRAIKSLAYCREEVEAQFAEWLESRVGKSEAEEAAAAPAASEAEAVPAHLASIAESLGRLASAAADPEFRETIDRVVARLAELRVELPSPERLEQSLESMESLVDDCLLRMPGNDDLRSEIDGAMEGYRNSMESEAFDRTYRLMLLKRLRERAGVPRFSLFYL